MTDDNPTCRCGHPLHPNHGDRAIAACAYESKNGSYTVTITCRCRGFQRATNIKNPQPVQPVPVGLGTGS